MKEPEFPLAEMLLFTGLMEQQTGRRLSPHQPAMIWDEDMNAWVAEGMPYPMRWAIMEFEKAHPFNDKHMADCEFCQSIPTLGG